MPTSLMKRKIVEPKGRSEAIRELDSNYVLPVLSIRHAILFQVLCWSVCAKPASYLLTSALLYFKWTYTFFILQPVHVTGDMAQWVKALAVTWVWSPEPTPTHNNNKLKLLNIETNDATMKSTTRKMNIFDTDLEAREIAADSWW